VLCVDLGFGTIAGSEKILGGVMLAKQRRQARWSGKAAGWRATRRARFKAAVAFSRREGPVRDRASGYASRSRAVPHASQVRRCCIEFYFGGGQDGAGR
jgi:hypothetical protein